MSRLPRCLTALVAAAIALAASPAASAQDGAPTAWQNGSNPQPASPLATGPFTWTLLVDTYYGFALHGPADHTVFPTTTAPRHNEIGLNMAMLGAEISGLDNVVGKLVLQSGHYVDTVVAPDPATGRGRYNSLASWRHVQQAYAGYTFGGTTFAMGLFPA